MVSFELTKYHSKTNKIKGNDPMKIGHFLSSSIEFNRTPGLFHAWLRPKKLMFYKNICCSLTFWNRTLGSRLGPKYSKMYFQNTGMILCNKGKKGQNFISHNLRYEVKVIRLL